MKISKKSKLKQPLEIPPVPQAGRDIIIEFIDDSTCETSADTFKSNKLMTQYEYISLWIVRAKQLRMGMPAKIEWNDNYNPIAIAKEEIKQGVVPLMIKRKIPDAKYVDGYRYEYLDVSEMNIKDV